MFNRIKQAGLTVGDQLPHWDDSPSNCEQDVEWVSQMLAAADFIEREAKNDDGNLHFSLID